MKFRRNSHYRNWRAKAFSISRVTHLERAGKDRLWARFNADRKGAAGYTLIRRARIGFVLLHPC